MNAPAPHASPAFQQLERLVLSMPMAQTLGLTFTRVAPGEVELEIPVLDAFTFRPGQLQATPVAQGVALRARGRVIDAGKLLTVCAADVYAVRRTGRRRCAPPCWARRAIST